MKFYIVTQECKDSACPEDEHTFTVLAGSIEVAAQVVFVFSLEHLIEASQRGRVIASALSDHEVRVTFFGVGTTYQVHDHPGIDDDLGPLMKIEDESLGVILRADGDPPPRIKIGGKEVEQYFAIGADSAEEKIAAALLQEVAGMEFN